MCLMETICASDKFCLGESRELSPKLDVNESAVHSMLKASLNRNTQNPGLDADQLTKCCDRNFQKLNFIVPLNVILNIFKNVI